MSLLITPDVTSIAKTGSTALNGAVTLTGGTNITLTQSGQDISIAAAGASISIGATVTSGTTGSILFVNAGPILAQDNANLFYDDTNNRMYLNTNAILISTATATLTIVNPSNLFNQIVATSSDTLAPNIAWYRSRGSIASKTSVQSGDVLGQFVFRGYNSTDTDYSDGAILQATVDGTPGSADLPTRLTFFTTPDGSASPAEAFRISSDQSGRFSGKVTIGATTAPDAQLDVMCASSSTKGEIIQGAASQSASLTEWQDSSANILSLVKANGDFQYLQSARTVSGNTAFFDSSTATITVSAAANLFMFRARNTFLLTTGHTIFNFDNFFLHNNTYKNDPSLTGSIAAQFNCFANLPTYTADTNATTMAEGQGRGFYDNPTFSRANSGTLAVTQWTGFAAAGINNTGVTITDRVCFGAFNMAGGTITNHYGLYINDLANHGSTITCGIYSAIASATAVWFIYGTGTADSSHKGNFRFGDNTAPTALIDVAGKLTISSSGLVTKYNNIATVSGGVPSELATVDLATQAAAIAATTLYTPAATGLFRISIYLQVTRAATTSSILGGATGVVITYNDGDGNVAQTDTAALATTAGAIAVTAAGNTTATNLEGTMVIYARTGVAIQYAIGYTSVGVTTMQFAAHLKVEAL